jgi:hypothetical protein
MMVNLPGGMAPSSREENWFLSTRPDEYQDLYVFVQAMRSELQDLSQDVRTFEKQASRADRKRIQKILKECSPEEKSEFTRRYRKLCHGVAESSAAIFNENLSTSLASRARRAVLEDLSRWFFRLDAVPYILCGIDDKEDFSLRVPDLTSWFREWEFADVVASPDLNRGQSVVDFIMTCRKKDDLSEQRIAYHAEIRWSHGRFSGSPESKLYKEFAWRDLPFLQEY